MRALRLHGLGDVRLDEIDPPAAPGPDEVLVAPLWCGLCGTDAREFLGPGGSVPDEPHPLTGTHKPVVLGHEFSARVVAVGSAVAGLDPGTDVAVLPLIGCGVCTACRRGQPILCPIKAWMGLSTPFGGLGDLAVVRADRAVPLGSVSERDGALVEPAAVALQAVMRAGVGPGDTVLVAGCGPIGMLTVMAALAVGADRVLAYDPRIELAATIGAVGGVALPSGSVDSLVDAVRDLAPDGVPVAIDCAGKPDSLELCVRAVRPGGTVCVPSVHTTRRSVDLWAVTRNALRLVGSLGYTADVWARTIALMQAGRLPARRIVTHTIERDAVAESLGAAADPARPQLKVLVRVGGA